MMGFNVKRVTNYLATSGNLNSIASGSIVSGPTMVMNDVEFGSRSATVTVDSETNTLTQDLIWEVSNDGSTWYRAKEMNNGTTTTLATGTSGADASVTVNIQAAQSVYGWRLCRASILTGGTTGTINDTYAISYNFVLKSFC